MVEEFLAYLAKNDIKIQIKDILLVGSNCSYNYTENSDLDIHVIAETSTLKCPDNLYPKLYSAYRSLFNDEININFYGIPVEVYVETEETSRISNGCYSVLNDKWVVEPDADAVPEVDQAAVDKAVKPWEEKYVELIAEIADSISSAAGKDFDEPNPAAGELNWADFSETVEALDCLYEDTYAQLTEETKTAEIDKIDKYIEDLYALRKQSLADDGEYGIGNLVFKEMRNKGYLDNLKKLKNKLIGKELSLEDNNKEALQELFGLKKKPVSTIDKRKAVEEITKACQSTVMVQDSGDFYVPRVNADQVQSVLNVLKNFPWVEEVTADKESVSIPDKYKHNKTKLPKGTCNIIGKVKLA